MSIYPEYKAKRSLFHRILAKSPAAQLRSGPKRDQGIRQRGTRRRLCIEQHLTKLLVNEDPFNVERIWDIMWRSTMWYGRKGLVINAISAVDLAMWDLVGKALNMPVYKLLGGETKPRIPAYCTGNDIEQHVEFGYKRLKLAIPHGPADGLEGMRKKSSSSSARARRSGPTATSCWTAGWRGPNATRSKSPR